VELLIAATLAPTHLRVRAEDLELLQIEMDLLWRANSGPELVVASVREGIRLRVTPAVPERLAHALRTEAESAHPNTDLMQPPPVVEHMRRQLEDALGAAVALVAGSGPSFLVHDGVQARVTAQVVRSNGPDVESLRAENPGNWPHDEWHDLVKGDLGPWVMATVDRRVVSICHTYRSNPHAAEAGVWTHPNHRGQGQAAACTAEWANLMRPTQRVLFYSTSSSNTSSQRVAARLALQHLGCLWQLSRAAGPVSLE